MKKVTQQKLINAFGPGDTGKILQLAVDGVTFEIEEMYPAYIGVAKLQEEKGALRSLKKYRSKRDFRKTKEPKGSSSRKSSKPMFVIQKHDASQLHYDFRLEIDGVLKSWAVPKGFSTDPRDRRLAIMTEDHPLEYGDFEGVIPEEEYGGGTVLIWDTGTYRNLKKEGDDPKTMTEALDEGHMTFWLEGEKIRGGYALINTKRGGKDNWLLIKMDDDEADARRNPVSTEPKSVKSGRTLKEIAADEKPEKVVREG